MFKVFKKRNLFLFIEPTLTATNNDTWTPPFCLFSGKYPSISLRNFIQGYNHPESPRMNKYTIWVYRIFKQPFIEFPFSELDQIVNKIISTIPEAYINTYLLILNDIKESSQNEKNRFFSTGYPKNVGTFEYLGKYKFYRKVFWTKVI